MERICAVINVPAFGLVLIEGTKFKGIFVGEFDFLEWELSLSGIFFLR